MNIRSNITKLTFLFVLVFISSFVAAQNVEYVGTKVITTHNGENYYYTKSITLTPPPGGSLTISGTSGDFFITPLVTNPPLSADQNYVRSEVAKTPISTETALDGLSRNDKAVSYSYADGVGRPTMSSAVEASQAYKDIVQFHKYNTLTGRQDMSYLPYVTDAGSPGSFQANAQIDQAVFYSGTSNIPIDTKPYSETTWDSRGRVETSIGVGQDWNSTNDANDKKVTNQYIVHDPSLTSDPVHDPILHWIIESGVPKNDRHYGTKELNVIVVTDTEQKMTRVVTNMRGQTITSQIYDPAASKWYGSYNVYDDMGRIRFVIPPIIASSLGSSFPTILTAIQITELLFEYEYDEEGRLKGERAPGAGWTEYIYDRWDRLILSQHAEQQYDGVQSWAFFKYDALNRLVVSGEVKTSQTRQQIIDDPEFNTKMRFESISSGSVGYTLNNSFPHLNDPDYDDYVLLAMSYFDNYDFVGWGTWDAEGLNFNFIKPSDFNAIKTNSVVNQLTGSKVRVLGDDTFLNTVTYYDNQLRVIQVVSENHLAGLDRLSNELDWKGELSKALIEHTGYSTLNVLTEYEYAHNGQLTKSWQTIDEPTNTPPITGDRILVSELKYNSVGQVVEKNLHSTNGTSFLQSVDYDYNIRGWISSINNVDLNDGEGDLFGMKFNYANSASVNNSVVPGRHDGLVSSFEWNSTNNVDASFGKTITGFNYDNRNRLLNARYATEVGGNYDNDPDDYDMSATYEDNGNIETLTRNSEGQAIDNLDYTYQAGSNKLINVEDLSPNEKGFDDTYQGTNYAYNNSMGNMTHDLNKEIVEIRYNHLQLVDKIAFGDGTEVRSKYDAIGNRLTREVFDRDDNKISGVDYVGLVEYLDGEVNQIFTDEGRAYKQNDSFHYEYFLTDHQGNNRVAFGNLPERNIYTATMETEKSSYEESEFTFPSGIRSMVQNHTPLGNESIALNGDSPGKAVGPAKVLNITTGDEVEIDVWAKYSSTTNWNNSSIGDIISLITSTFTGASSGTGGEGAFGNLGTTLGSPDTKIFTGNATDEPQAYLQYIFFDANYAYVPGKSNFKAVGSASEDRFEKLSSEKLVFDQPGYLFVYVVNESDQNADVFFDDLRIIHSSDIENFKVSQVNEFYPFGLATDKSWRANGYVDPGLLYQSAFTQYDSLTGYYDFLSRNYDPVVGRFFAVDPAGQFSSPYTGMGNAPHMGVDPNGEIFGFLIGSALAAVGQAGVQSLNGNGSFKSNLVNNGFVVGGGYGQNQSYIGAGTASLGIVSTYNFPNQGSPIFGGFSRPSTPSNYSLPGPHQGGNLIANTVPTQGSGNYDFIGALNRRNTFYPTVRPELGGGLGGVFGLNPCPICDIQPGDWVDGPPPGYYDRRSGGQSDPAFVFSSAFERGASLASTIVGGSFSAGASQAARNGRYVATALRGARVGGAVFGAVGFGATAYNFGAKYVNNAHNAADYVDLGASGALLGASFFVSNPIGWGILIGAGVTYGIYRISYGNQADIWINQNFGFR